MDKIVRALVVIAEEEYDEGQQSRFVNEKRDFGNLEHRKQQIERKRDVLGLKEKAKSESRIQFEDKPKPLHGISKNSIHNTATRSKRSLPGNKKSDHKQSENGKDEKKLVEPK